MGACLLVVLCTLAFVATFLQRSLREEMTVQVREGMAKNLRLCREIISKRWTVGASMSETDQLADLLGRTLNLRLSLILPDGVVAGDSEQSIEDLSQLENHAGRPEVIHALAGGFGWSQRYSSTLRMNLLYVAELLGRPDAPLLVVRLALPLREMEESLSEVRDLILLASLIGVVLSLGVAFFVAQRISRPVKELTRTALDIASGDLTKRLRRYPAHEVGELGRAFDRMAEHLQEEIVAVTQARDRLEAILRGMVEGVLVTDESGAITLANRALRRMLNLMISPIGRRPSEIMRNAELIEAIRRVSTDNPVISLEVRTLYPSPRILEVVVAALPGIMGRSGVVAVFHDITQRKQVEEMRRDFVANVSHELRTPLAAVRGAVETLLDGALEDPMHRRRFTEVIERHVKRLESMVYDLLELARLESGQASVQLESVDVAELMGTVRTALAAPASERGVEVQIDPPEQTVRITGQRRQLEQALGNLLDNAIKYVGPEGRVRIAACRDNDQVRIEVVDNGPGIAPEHLGRIFERFYRVDKNRSRELGGTGLGLSIVKHIAQTHGGRVEVDSFPGRGSTFRLILPVEVAPSPS
ncbi:MAG: HAMP domain-containing protein [Proteobacteria bacterium]|nr:HAMP domain-containing protein [Pseudomonadota bacterium]